MVLLADCYASITDMNEQIKNIRTWLEDDSVFETAEGYLKSNPDYAHAVNNTPVKPDDSLELLNYIKTIILQAISNCLFEKLPIQIQLNIHNQVQAVYQQRTNISQFITYIHSLHHIVFVADLEKKLDNYDSFKKALSDIANLRRSYSKSLNGLNDLIRKVKIIDENFIQSQELIESFLGKKKKIEAHLADS